MEKYLGQPRHIEVQVSPTAHGKVVHLGERDCSLQRRHQKVLGGSPLARAQHRRTRRNRRASPPTPSRKLGYLGAGTIEFLYEDGEFYFIEMNTRLQVEHPVTEAITGIDIVREQIRIAAGAAARFNQEDVVFEGHAIECRINAENPFTFRPSPGLITEFHAPGGLGVRFDSALYAGYRIPPYYDSLAGKLIVHGRDRNECLLRLRRALDEMVVGGIETTIPLFQELLGEPDIINGDYHIHWLEQWIENSKADEADVARDDGFDLQDLIACYRQGVFPMADARDDAAHLPGRSRPARHHPAGRLPHPRRLARTVRANAFTVKVDTAFEAVVEACARDRRRAGTETWINLPIQQLYCDLYRNGSAHSVECWRGRRAGRRPLWRGAGRGLLRREHVLLRPRRLEGRAGPSGRAPDHRRLPAAGRPVHHRAPGPVRRARDRAHRIPAACWRWR